MRDILGPSMPSFEARGSPLERLLTEHRVLRRAAQRAGGNALTSGRKRKHLGERPMRDIETIDRELRLLARERREARHLNGRTQSTARIDQLLDERAATSAGQRTNSSTTASMAARLANCS
jgi:hypothetical protein